MVLGKLIADRSVNNQVKQGIETLGELQRDRAFEVRKLAVKSLGKIRSEAVIPYFKKAQKDANLEVVKVASEILQNYKSYVETFQKELPKNSALREQN